MTGQIYTLKTPKDIAGKKISTLHVREMELDDVIALAEIDRQDLRALKSFVARVTGVDEAVIGRLSMGDFQGVLAAATGPLPVAHGETLSGSGARFQDILPPTS